MNEIILPTWVQYADRAIESFLGVRPWRSRQITAAATELMTAAGETLPRTTGQSASSRLIPTRFDAFRLGVRLWASLPKRCPHCSGISDCDECIRFANYQPLSYLPRAETPPPVVAVHNAYHAHDADRTPMHDACPRRGAYCSMTERDALRLAVPGAHDASFSFTPDNRRVRAFVRFGEKSDPRSATYRMWEFDRTLLLDETVLGLARAGNYNIIPDPVTEAGHDYLGITLQSDTAMLMAFALAVRVGGDGEIPALPAPGVCLHRPTKPSQRVG